MDNTETCHKHDMVVADMRPMPRFRFEFSDFTFNVDTANADMNEKNDALVRELFELQSQCEDHSEEEDGEGDSDSGYAKQV